MQQLVLILYILTCVSLIALVLLQHGKGADIGASFGSGASQTLFGSQGSAPFLFKLTMAMAAIFFGLCLILGYISKETNKSKQDLILPNQNPTIIPVTSPENGSSTENTLESDKENNKSITKQTN